MATWRVVANVNVKCTWRLVNVIGRVNVHTSGALHTRAPLTEWPSEELAWQSYILLDIHSSFTSNVCWASRLSGPTAGALGAAMLKLLSIRHNCESSVRFDKKVLRSNLTCRLENSNRSCDIRMRCKAGVRRRLLSKRMLRGLYHVSSDMHRKLRIISGLPIKNPALQSWCNWRLRWSLATCLRWPTAAAWRCKRLIRPPSISPPPNPSGPAIAVACDVKTFAISQPPTEKNGTH